MLTYYLMNATFTEKSNQATIFILLNEHELDFLVIKQLNFLCKGADYDLSYHVCNVHEII